MDVLELGLAGKVAIVTGGSEGLGRACVERFARSGAKVAACARRKDVLERNVDEIRRATGGEILAMATDVTHGNEVEAFVAATVAQFGGVDILVNNAGTSLAAGFEQVDEATWQYDFDLKVMGAIRLCRLVIPHMKRRGGGRIINVTTVGGKAPLARSLPTSVSRAAGINLTKSLANEYAADKILVNTICLGIVKSAQHERRAKGDLEAHYRELAEKRRLPLGRVGAASGKAMTAKLALHTWTLESTALPDVLRATRAAGWDGVELRRVDFARAAEKGQPAADVLKLVKASGLGVACVGVEMGWMFADGADHQRLMQAFTESCRWASELGCATVMSASDRGRGDLTRAAANMRAAGDVAAAHRVKLAVEFNSQAEQLNHLEVMRGIVAKAAHASCGLLLDTYHLQRSGATLKAIDDVTLGEIAYVQYSDVPRTGLEPGKALDRLPPGRGSVPFKEIFGLLDRKGYRGFMSYEAPNPAAWARPADEVAREALEATRAHLPAR